MPAWSGRFEGHSPRIDVTIAGTQGHPECMTGTLDTGFSGFLLMHVGAAQPHGLEARGTTYGNLADGKRTPFMLAFAQVGFANVSRRGVVALSPLPCETLIGISFLRTFDLALVIDHKNICLVSASSVNGLPGWRYGPPDPSAG